MTGCTLLPLVTDHSPWAGRGPSLLVAIYAPVVAVTIMWRSAGE